MTKIFKWALNFFPRPLLIKLSLPFRKLVDLFLRGSNFTDPINGKNYRKFLPYGYENPRQNALSPGTLSLERHRLLWLFLKEKTTFFSQESKVLHMAPEQCFLALFKKNKNLDYTTADLYSPIADVKADILNLPFDDNSFDWILCNHVLEHIEDDKKALSELLRVLKKGGQAVFQVPLEYDRETTYEDFSITEPEERRKHFGQYDHVRVYGRDYFKKLEAAGFIVEEVHLQNQLGKDKVHQYGLSPNETIPYCKKPL